MIIKINKFNNLFLIFIVFVFTLQSVFAISGSSSSSSLSDMSEISLVLLNQYPDPVVAGDFLELRFNLNNNGGEAVEDIKVNLLPSYPFEFIPSENYSIEVDSLDGYQSGDRSQTLKYKLRVAKDIPAGFYDIDMEYYIDGDKIPTQVSFPIEIKNQESAEIISIDQTELIPGQKTPITFTISNTGYSDLDNLQFSWENEDQLVLPVGSDNTKYIKYLPVNGSVDLMYNVIADTNVDSGLYQLKLYLSYLDPITETEKVISSVAGIYIGGETDFDVSYSDSSDSDMSFNIANIGSNPAYSVTVSVPNQDSWAVSGSKSSIIGNLDIGDYTISSFQITQANAGQNILTKENREIPSQSEIQNIRNLRQNAESPDTAQASNSNEIIIEISYTDTMGNRNTIQKTVSVNTDSSSPTMGIEKRRGMMQQQSFFDKYKWHIIVVVIVVFGLIIRKYKHQKKIKPKLTIKTFLLSLSPLSKKKQSKR